MSFFTAGGYEQGKENYPAEFSHGSKDTSF
jgi:hypothetical protein